MIAAATTSLPETPGGERNWDYRYTLDPRLDVHAVGPVHARLRLGGQRLLLLHRRRRRARRAELQIMYGIGGERELDGADARPPHGYDGARPVRIGNGAYNQRQHDVWGAVLDSVYLHTKSRDHLPERMWPILKRAGRSTPSTHWREPDRGIWEVRGEPQALHLVEGDVLGRGRPRRAAGRDRARTATVAARGRRPPTRSTPTSAPTRVDERGRVRAALRHRRARRLGAADAAGAASCRPTIRGFAPRCWRSPTSSPRTAWCCATASTRPTTGSRARRARSRSARSGWCRRSSRSASIERARELCEKLLSLRQPARLYAEEIDPRSGRHLGNFPQAFTHLALINAVMHVIRCGGDESTAHPIWRPSSFVDGCRSGSWTRGALHAGAIELGATVVGECGAGSVVVDVASAVVDPHSRSRFSSLEKSHRYRQDGTPALVQRAAGLSYQVGGTAWRSARKSDGAVPLQSQ